VSANAWRVTGSPHGDGVGEQHDADQDSRPAQARAHLAGAEPEVAPRAAVPAGEHQQETGGRQARQHVRLRQQPVVQQVGRDQDRQDGGDVAPLCSSLS